MATKDLLQQKIWRFIDHSQIGTLPSPLHSFAADDTLCTSVGGGTSSAVCRTWIHKNTIVLGIADSRLPFLEEGRQFLTEQGYQSIVRNSGGLAVVLDEGVISLSFVLPNTSKTIEINDGYEAMWQFIQDLFQSYHVTIEAKEIVGSYCPGSYDLSIDGKKFAGISQRRMKNGIAVQIYLCVEGSGSQRAELIQAFYERSLQQTETRFEYPKIVPSTMASLSELLQVSLTTSDVQEKIIETLQSYGSEVEFSQFSSVEEDMYRSYVKRIIDRNENFL